MAPEAHNVAEALDRGIAQPEPADPAAGGGVRVAPVVWLWVWLALIGLAGAAATIAGALRQQNTGLFIPALTLGFLLLAAGFDAATKRIPNPLTYTAILLGFGLNGAAWVFGRLEMGAVGQWLGALGPTQAVIGLLVCGGVGMLCMIGGGFGGGDMKVVAAMGGLLGITRSLDVLLVGLAVAAVYALVNLIVRGGMNRVMGYVAANLLSLFYLHRPGPMPPESDRKIPLAFPLMIGLIVSQVLSFGLARVGL